MSKQYNNDQEKIITAENLLKNFNTSYVNNMLHVYIPYVSSMIMHSKSNNPVKKHKVILDDILTLAIQSQEYLLLDKMKILVSTLENYMHHKGFIDDGYYVVPMGVDTHM